MAGGRQREFDKVEALDNAMRVFWQKGYVGSSLTDLTGGMGINKPSMYSAFGNKEQLFVQSIYYYIKHYAEQLGESLVTEQPLKVRLRNYLESTIILQCRDDTPKGCFVSLCITEFEGQVFPEKSAQIIEELSTFVERFLMDFFEKEVARKTLPSKTNVVELARYFAVFMHGTAAMSRGGKTQEELVSLLDLVLQVIPANES